MLKLKDNYCSVISYFSATFVCLKKEIYLIVYSKCHDNMVGTADQDEATD